ncbi:MAG: LamG domain-containing protein [Candidatus Micrarchaeota archaeon]|nr:LamG domain-containing protein [Candidatus Micrarchaeota archaeon]
MKGEEPYNPPNVSVFVRLKKFGWLPKWYVPLVVKPGDSWGLWIKEWNSIKACVNTTQVKCVEASVNLNDGSFHEVGMVYNGTHLSLWFDGSPVGWVSQTGNIFYTGVNYIEAYPNGEIDYIRLFSGVVTPAVEYVFSD